MTKTQILKMQNKRRKERRRKNIVEVILFVLIAGIITIPLYNKANKERICYVHSVNENSITVRHPNGGLYDFYTDNSKQYEKDILITVIFNELTDWKKNYVAKGVKSK